MSPPPGLLIGAALTLVPLPLYARQWAVSPELTQILSAGPGIEFSACRESSYGSSLGLGFTTPRVLGPVTVTAHARAYLLGWATGGCDVVITSALIADPPGTGIFTTTRYDKLQRERFYTTDLRMTLDLVRDLRIGLGVGGAWRSGADLPYVVMSAAYSFPTTGKVQFGFNLEYAQLHARRDQTRRTIENYRVVSTEQLRSRVWSHSLAFGLFARIPVGR